ncbi:acyltransferase family protein [Pedobacter zeae]|uniref:Peptidoglycan/LPS O-acetylase OafA/YrhL n=1 Tax=Pedobacter zeae TaxID=1737356 RepID=A0A7W6K9Q8_9SPHI|nr:acyltransferase [Pedobacter zeae]MBB4107789.1 peptidoglycan/LPS O-acetylase OafA/YrhL [Pedobacter zeae]
MLESKAQAWFKGLDTIRFICALIVLLSHVFTHPNYEKSLNSDFTRSLAELLRVSFNGTAAVIIFFIISGFLIHSTSKNQVLDIKKFYARRFVRILAPLFIVYLLGYKYNHPEKAVLWSLICELFYYFLYPFMLVIKQSWDIKFIFSFVVSLITISFFAFSDIHALISQSPIGYHGYYWQLGPLFTWIIGLPCWLLGVLIAENINKKVRVQSKRIFFLRILVFLTAVLFNFLKIEYLLSFIISMNFFALLSYYWLRLEIIYFRNKTPFRPLELLGKSSYSLYIIHPLVIVIMSQLLSFDNRNVIPIVVITVTLSHIFYLLIEKPAHNLAKRFAIWL